MVKGGDGISNLPEPTTQPPIVLTANAANLMETLGRLARELTSLCLRRRLMEELRRSGVGTYNI